MIKSFLLVLTATIFVAPAVARADHCDDALTSLKQRVCAAERVMKQQSGSDDDRGRFVAAMHGAVQQARAACGRTSLRIDDAIEAAKSKSCGL